MIKKILTITAFLILTTSNIYLYINLQLVRTMNDKMYEVNQIKTEWIKKTDNIAKMIYGIFQEQNKLFSNLIETGRIPTVSEIESLSNKVNEYNSVNDEFNVWKKQAIEEMNSTGMVKINQY